MSWNRPPRGYTQVVEAAVAQRRTRIALDTLRGVILGSPVDTGRFRSNNQAAYGSPAAGEVPSGGAGGAGASSAIARGAEQIATRADSPYEIVWVGNNLLYGPFLEAGGSKRQAPDGIYRLVFHGITVKYAL